MDPQFLDDLTSLCGTAVSSFEEAQTVLSLLCELISHELGTLSDESLAECWMAIVNSRAYQFSPPESRGLLIKWLLEVDKLQTDRLFFIGELIYNDHAELGSNCLEIQEAVVKSVIEAIWLYRYTDPRMTRTFLLILYQICVQSEITFEVLETCISESFVRFLYREIREMENMREILLVLLVLNDQFMMHDKRGPNNLAFHVLQESPLENTFVGSSLVWIFNRCEETDQDLKIFVCKFLYLMFTTPNTKELLYTNDLVVLVEILMRELNDLSTDAVEVRAMYLRVLHAIIASSAASLMHLREPLIDVVHLTMDGADSLEPESKAEILRLSARCLSVPWLNGEEARGATPPAIDYTAIPGARRGYELTPTVHVTETKSALRGPVPPPPPPPHRPYHRNESISSVISSDSKHSMQAVEHVRAPLPPPPPPPPRPPRSRIQVPEQR